jgi:hypothetical protein
VWILHHHHHHQYGLIALVCTDAEVLIKVKQPHNTPMEAQGGEDVYLLLIHDLCSSRWVSGQRHAPAALYPKGRTSGTHWTGGWMCPEPVWTQRLQENLLLFRGSNVDRPVVESVVRHYTAWATRLLLRGRVVNTRASYSGGPGFKSRSGYRLLWPKSFFFWFSQSLQANSCIVP